MTLSQDLGKVREARQEAEAAFLKDPETQALCWRLTEIADGVLLELFEPFAGLPLAVVATGGYGRRELAPGSDIDVTFIPLDEDDDSIAEPVRALFRSLVDTFGQLKWPVGYAYRLRSDCPALDDKTRTGLLDARLVAGSADALREFQIAFRSDFPVAEFLIAKLKERKEMRAKWQSTPRVAEFHLKEGAGGLRDFQTAGWFFDVLGIGPKDRPNCDYELLLRVRNALHLATGRKEDRLIHTRRTEVAKSLGLSPEDFEDQVICAAVTIDDHARAAIETSLSTPFTLAVNVDAEDGTCRVREGATLSSAATGVSRAVSLGLKLAPSFAGPEIGDGPLVIDAMTASSKSVRGLDETGLLSMMLPEFARCERLLSTDPMHVYTVGEHSLRAVEELEGSRQESELAEAWSEVGNPRPLFLAALLHDLGKAVQGHHSETGAAIAADVCERYRVGHSETETVVWLVRNHLLFAQTARTHDLGHPKTALQLASQCKHQDRLAMLYLLTVADIRSVSDSVWTPQIAVACAELYTRARSALGIEEIPEDPAVYRSEALRRVKGAATENLLNTMPTHYLLATPAELFPLHANYIARARKGETVVEFQTQNETATTDITVCLRDLAQPGLLSRVLGVIYAFDLTVHAVRAAGTVEDESVALDVITVSFKGQPMPSTLSRFVAAELQRCLTNEEELHALMRKHDKDPVQKQSMLTYRFRESDLGILDVETPLGRGMPYRVARMLAGFGWNIHVARIGQWAGRAVARFYIDTPNGKLTEDAVKSALGDRNP